MIETVAQLLDNILEGEDRRDGKPEGLIANSVRNLLPEDLQSRTEDVALLVMRALRAQASESDEVRAVLNGWHTRIADAVKLPKEHPARRLVEGLQVLQDTLK